MTRKYIVRHGVGYAIGMIIANIVGAFIWPTSVTDFVIRILIGLLGTAGMTALLYRWTSLQERPPDADKSIDE